MSLLARGSSPCPHRPGAHASAPAVAAQRHLRAACAGDAPELRGQLGRAGARARLPRRVRAHLCRRGARRRGAIVDRAAAERRVAAQQQPARARGRARDADFAEAAPAASRHPCLLERDGAPAGRRHAATP
eukprot:scaffold103397_cov66-Phaeocystis_antarctica.AAC.1